MFFLDWRNFFLKRKKREKNLPEIIFYKLICFNINYLFVYNFSINCNILFCVKRNLNLIIYKKNLIKLYYFSYWFFVHCFFIFPSILFFRLIFSLFFNLSFLRENRIYILKNLFQFIYFCLCLVFWYFSFNIIFSLKIKILKKIIETSLQYQVLNINFNNFDN